MVSELYKLINDVYVINLPEAIDRRNTILTQCKRDDVQLSPRIIDATRGSQLTHYQLRQLVTPRMQTKLSPTTVAVAFSHYRIWKKIQQSKRNALILEDDAVFAHDFNEKVKPVVKECPDDFDILYLGCMNCTLTPDWSTKILDVFRSNEWLTKSKTKHINVPGYPIHMHGYCISVKGANKLCKLIEEQGIDDHIDAYVAERKSMLNIYSAEPSLIFQPVSVFQSSNLKSTYPHILNQAIEPLTNINQGHINYGLTQSRLEVFGVPINPWLYILMLIVPLMVLLFGITNTIVLVTIYHVLENKHTGVISAKVGILLILESMVAYNIIKFI